MSLKIQSADKTKCSIKGGEMDNLWLVFSWGSPIGVGIFLVCLGAMIYVLTKADEKSKQAKAFAKEKGLDKK
jgi:heme/copper-type cytochrome/quinol oxidase subunit 2